MADPQSELEDIVADYEYAAIISSSEERNQAFRRADEADMPVVWIEPKRKYGDVECDFVSASPHVKGLDDSSYEFLCALNDQYMGRTLRRCKQSHRTDVSSSPGSYVPTFSGLLLDDMPDYVNRFLQIIYDKDNWEYREEF